MYCLDVGYAEGPLGQCFARRPRSLLRVAVELDRADKDFVLEKGAQLASDTIVWVASLAAKLLFNEPVVNLRKMV